MLPFTNILIVLDPFYLRAPALSLPEILNALPDPTLMNSKKHKLSTRTLGKKGYIENVCFWWGIALPSERI